MDRPTRQCSRGSRSWPTNCLPTPLSKSFQFVALSSQESGYTCARWAISRYVRTQRKTRPDVQFCLVFRRESMSVPAMRHVLGDTLRRLGVKEDSVADILL